MGRRVGREPRGALVVLIVVWSAVRVMPVALTAGRLLTGVMAPVVVVRRTCGCRWAVVRRAGVRCLIVLSSGRAAVVVVARVGRATRWVVRVAVAAALSAPTAVARSMVATMGSRPRALLNRRVGLGGSTLVGAILVLMVTIRALVVMVPMASPVRAVSGVLGTVPVPAPRIRRARVVKTLRVPAVGRVVVGAVGTSVAVAALAGAVPSVAVAAPVAAGQAAVPTPQRLSPPPR